MFDPFDLNRDGKVDDWELNLALDEFLCVTENENNSSLMDDDDEDEDELELESAGIDPDDFEYMDDDERREALEDAGLDPDDFDMDF